MIITSFKLPFWWVLDSNAHLCWLHPHFGLIKPRPFSHRESRRRRQIGEHNVEVAQAHLPFGHEIGAAWDLGLPRNGLTPFFDREMIKNMVSQGNYGFSDTPVSLPGKRDRNP